MENIYSITVKNKFSLALDEDADPLEILKLQEQQKEAKRKEKLNEKSKQQQEQKTAQPVAKEQQQASKKSRQNKENVQHQQPQQQHHHQPSQQSKNQDSKRDQADKKPAHPRNGGERNVKFSENREDHNNRRNREDGERPPRIQNNDYRRGPPGEQRDRDHPYQGTREFRNSKITGVAEGERRGPRPGGFDRRGARAGGPGGQGGIRRGGFDNRGKREYDRQSGSDKTGVKSIDKKDGAGSHNWGTHNDEIEESMNTSEVWESIGEKTDLDSSNSASNENKDATNTSGDVAPVEGDSSAPTEAEKAEEEARELTLDEWKALRQNKRVTPTYNLRKAGEGEDLSRWKKMYALDRKKEGVDEEDEEEEEYDAAEYPQRVGRQKHLLNIEIHFSDSRRSGGGRGGRGGRGRGDRMNGRGFGNRGPREGDREYRTGGGGAGGGEHQRSPREPRQNAPKVDDEHDFPSLG